jgi:centrin-3
LLILVTERILSRDPLEEIRKAFKLFDEDGTGRISLRNLRHIAMELGENIDDDELRAMIDEFDLDGDGESKNYNYILSYYFHLILILLVNEQEFIAIMTEAEA